MSYIKSAVDAAKEAIEGGSELYSNENPCNARVFIVLCQREVPVLHRMRLLF